MIAIARATPENLPFILATERLPGYDALVGRWDEARHREALAAPHFAYFIARRDGAPVGFAILRDWNAPERVTKVQRIAVSDPGAGTGRALLRAVADAAFTETLVHRLWLGVFPDNLRAQRAYAAVGFVPEGIARGSAFFGGLHRDELVMSLIRPDWEAARAASSRAKPAADEGPSAAHPPCRDDPDRLRRGSARGIRATGRRGPRDDLRARLHRLVAAYPDHLTATDGETLTWRDGTRTPTGLRLPERPFDVMLRDATVADMLRQSYWLGPLTVMPPRDHSPGRLRNGEFFNRLYGDCRAAPPPTRPVTWMPRTGSGRGRPQRLSVTTVNDVAGRLERVIEALEGLPARMKAFLVPSSGTLSCRAVADTGLPSMHGTGAAIDLNARNADYWAWARTRSSDVPYRNRIPWEIAECFEAERFAWGGKWYHYDTMHFEYRPELFPA
ncbi:GNAT family N-acetyltransferase [Roseomonas sp. CCTCC AB2023176]|uniref:GNAT family N-acetyltransferase n=1 Tax=Roseomonas sp. CCTCC AB2023176 TaxID=3342640 RepID=UPI0035DD8AC9